MVQIQTLLLFIIWYKGGITFRHVVIGLGGEIF